VWVVASIIWAFFGFAITMDDIHDRLEAEARRRNPNLGAYVPVFYKAEHYLEAAAVALGPPLLVLIIGVIVYVAGRWTWRGFVGE
jgi:hypothetical protein